MVKARQNETGRQAVIKRFRALLKVKRRGDRLGPPTPRIRKLMKLADLQPPLPSNDRWSQPSHKKVVLNCNKKGNTPRGKKIVDVKAVRISGRGNVRVKQGKKWIPIPSTLVLVKNTTKGNPTLAEIICLTVDNKHINEGLGRFIAKCTPQLMASGFRTRTRTRCEVHHIDGNTLNNAPKNLGMYMSHTLKVFNFYFFFK